MATITTTTQRPLNTGNAGNIATPTPANNNEPVGKAQTTTNAPNTQNVAAAYVGTTTKTDTPNANPVKTVSSPAMDRIRGRVAEAISSLLVVERGMEMITRARDEGRMHMPTETQKSFDESVGKAPRRNMSFFDQMFSPVAQPDLTAAERAAIVDGAKKILAGAAMPCGVATICNKGHGDYQTLISLADVGAGHLQYTLRDNEMMRGLVVHHEHIDRPSKEVAPYRLVDAEMNTLVNYMAAGKSPVTMYYGMPNYDAWAAGEMTKAAPGLKGDGSDEDWKKFVAWEHSEISAAYKRDPVTAAHGVAAAASAAFANGTADVKVAMDGLTATQAIDIMHHIDQATDRDSRVQSLAAAFNLNRPIVDDRPETLAKNGGKPVTVETPYAIAMLGVELAKAGGWEKVTTDSASDKIPSTPLLDLIQQDGTAKGNPNALMEWVHAAHSAGLETYVSGGMKAEHFTELVRSGVGGVGVGFSMHHREPTSGVVGDIDPAKIHAAQASRDKAEASTIGQGARLLVQLDFDFAAPGQVDLAKNAMRENLFNAIHANDEGAVRTILDSAVKQGIFVDRGQALELAKTPQGL